VAGFIIFFATLTSPSHPQQERVARDRPKRIMPMPREAINETKDRSRSVSHSSKRLGQAKALMNAASDTAAGGSRTSVVGKLSAGVSGFFSAGKSKKGALQHDSSAKFPTSGRSASSKSKPYESVGDEEDDDDDDEFEDPRVRVRQLLGASSGRIVKSVMAQPSAIKKHIKAHADLIAEKERQRLDDMKSARAERAKELELERRKRRERWLRRQGQATTPADDTELQLRLMQEEERRLALTAKRLQDFDAPWHTNTLAGISQVLGELEAEDTSQPVPPPLDDAEEASAQFKAEGEFARLTVAETGPDYMCRADDILSNADGKAPLTPWSIAALPDQQLDDDAEAVPYGSQKKKAEENESWADMLERTKRSLRRDRDKSRQKARKAVGLTSSTFASDQHQLDAEDEGPVSVRQDRAASSAEEHRMLPKSEREWSFVPRQKVRNDVLLLAQRGGKNK
jgi:hypothetical protein